MTVNALPSEPSEGRTAERSNVFVIATLYCAAGSAPVRVRNLSPSGALIEGSVLPLPGSRVRLSRGSLQASGEVVWCSDGRAGLAFAASIMVAEWLPGAGTSERQQRVDEVVFKAKYALPAESDKPRQESLCMPSEVGLEIGLLASGLTHLCEQFADDPHVATRFTEQLQTMEATARRLDRLASAALRPSN